MHLVDDCYMQTIVIYLLEILRGTTQMFLISVRTHARTITEGFQDQNRRGEWYLINRLLTCFRNGVRCSACCTDRSQTVLRDVSLDIIKLIYYSTSIIPLRFY